MLATTEFEATPFEITLIEGQIPETPEPEIEICFGRLFPKPRSQGMYKREREPRTRLKLLEAAHKI